MGALSTDPTGAPSLDPAGGLWSPDPLICPPLEEILRAPTLREQHRRIQDFYAGCTHERSHFQVGVVKGMGFAAHPA